MLFFITSYVIFIKLYRKIRLLIKRTKIIKKGDVFYRIKPSLAGQNVSKISRAYDYIIITVPPKQNDEGVRILKYQPCIYDDNFTSVYKV
jgi:hypothetical protein